MRESSSARAVSGLDPLGPMLGDLRLVTFMTDFGLRDPSAGVLSGVVLAMTPDARTLDLTHAIPPYDVEAGAEALVESLVHLPVGAHVAVVDLDLAACAAVAAYVEGIEGEIPK